MPVYGAKEHQRRLRRMRGAIVQPITNACLQEAEDVAKDAQFSITQGSISGKGHVPSKPGEPPNADTRVLDGNIEGKSTGPFKAESSSNAPYAASLEGGTSRMEPRPYMGPAAKISRKRFPKRLVRAVNKVVRRAG